MLNDGAASEEESVPEDFAAMEHGKGNVWLMHTLSDCLSDQGQACIVLKKCKQTDSTVLLMGPHRVRVCYQGW